LWPGGIHLAQTFDTLGWIFRDLRDAPRLAEGLFGLKVPEVKAFEARVGVIAESFLHDCDAAVLSGFEKCKEMLTGAGAQVLSFAASGWDDAMSIYAPIQASEAAAIHVGPTGGDFSVFPKPIDERLAWGASLTKDEIDKQRKRHGEFRSGIHELFRSFDFLMMPCSPISKLEAGKDHTKTRAQILRYTVPFSLAGTPVVTLPLLGGVGMQLAAAREKDSQLLAFAAAI
jgi:aspartyl-tRNA(Asn)/glutamyl-tRNA(Gln) amidotransferase subunit A